MRVLIFGEWWGCGVVDELRGEMGRFMLNK